MMEDTDEHVDREDEPSAEVDVDEIPEECRDALRRVYIYTTRPDRKVFVDRDDCDRWISTDRTVDVVE